eukprot:354335-Chlamydomonas_euryale.AAC.2
MLYDVYRRISVFESPGAVCWFWTVLGVLSVLGIPGAGSRVQLACPAVACGTCAPRYRRAAFLGANEMWRCCIDGCDGVRAAASPGKG